MKKKLTLTLFLAIFALFSYSQSTYNNTIKEIVENRVKNYPTDGENITHVKNIIIAFNNANKAVEEDYKKRNIGVAIALAEEDLNDTNKYNDPLIYPALISHNNSKIDISALRTPVGNTPNPNLEKYNKTYLYDYTKIGSTKVFQKLITAKPNAEGTYKENDNEIIVEDPLSLSYIRSDSDWIYIISIDKNYENLATPRILIYAMKKNFSGKNIFAPSK